MDEFIYRVQLIYFGFLSLKSLLEIVESLEEHQHLKKEQ